MTSGTFGWATVSVAVEVAEGAMMVTLINRYGHNLPYLIKFVTPDGNWEGVMAIHTQDLRRLAIHTSDDVRVGPFFASTQAQSEHIA